MKYISNFRKVGRDLQANFKYFTCSVAVLNAFRCFCSCFIKCFWNKLWNSTTYTLFAGCFFPCLWCRILIKEKVMYSLLHLLSKISQLTRRNYPHITFKTELCWFCYNIAPAIVSYTPKKIKRLFSINLRSLKNYSATFCFNFSTFCFSRYPLHLYVKQGTWFICWCIRKPRRHCSFRSKNVTRSEGGSFLETSFVVFSKNI